MITNIFHATVDRIRSTETEHAISDHVDPMTMEAWAKTPQQAKDLLVAAFEKRVAGATKSLALAEQNLKKAQALKVPE